MSPSLQWKQVHEIRAEDGTIARVQRRGDIRPQYSLQLGRERHESADDRLLPFVSIRIERNAVVNRNVLDLVRAALDWIEGDAAAYEVQYAERETSVRNGEMPRKKSKRR